MWGATPEGCDEGEGAPRKFVGVNSSSMAQMKQDASLSSTSIG